MARTLTRTQFAIAASLAALAGYVDGIGFLALGGYFVSFMSGNTTRAGVELVGMDLGAAGLGLLVIMSFVAGVIAGTVISSDTHDRGPMVLVAVAVFIAAAALLSNLDVRWPMAILLAAGMGAVNTVFSGRAEASFGITYMTGALVKIGQGIVAALRGGDRTGWLRYLVLWLAIALGAIGGAAVYGGIGHWGLWGGAATAILIAGVLRLRARTLSART
ncbi:YoaK family protein [Microbacterium sediminicola]|uniref:YoaK family protein n=1 Tax=Microbacterium sediminicola TaxID=415210 RepID=A0ABN2HWP1_9MICO